MRISIETALKRAQKPTRPPMLVAIRTCLIAIQTVVAIDMINESATPALVVHVGRPSTVSIVPKAARILKKTFRMSIWYASKPSASAAVEYMKWRLFHSSRSRTVWATDGPRAQAVDATQRGRNNASEIPALRDRRPGHVRP